MLQSLFLISTHGEVLIEKHWRGVTPRTICDFFWDEVTRRDRREDVPPVIETPKYYLISVVRGDLFLLATSTGEVPPLLAIEFLDRVYAILEEYLEGSVDESSIKENFATVYQLLEEMMDNGYPLTTEPNALKVMIKPPSMLGRITAAATGASGVSDVLPDGTVSSMPWRKAGVRYAQNEIYVDIVEEIDAIVDRDGQIISSEVSGAIHANSRLSGIPDLTLTFVDPELIDDCSFHPCVRYNRYERDRVVSFVPPDGQFELMRYRVTPQGHIAPPIFCQPQMSFEYATGQGQLTVIVGYKPQNSLIIPTRRGAPPIEEVEVTIPFSRTVRTANLSVTAGTCLYDEATKVAKWTIGKLSKDRSPQLNGTILLQTGAQPEETPPIQLEWKVPTASVSGLAVAALTLTNEKYRPYKGVRTITKSGRFQVRSS